MKIAGVLFFALTVLAAGAAYAFGVRELNEAAAKLPRLEDFRRDLSGRNTEVVSADGQVLFTIAAEFREPIRIGDVPKVVQDATLAAEDRRFYEHRGIDPIALVRQLFTNLRARRIEGGASTLTMQLAKRLSGDAAQTLERKVDDMALALLIERRYTKDEILEMYLNQVFYGSQAYGIQAAADVYFGKTLDQLTIGEAALLARCVRLPSRENPFVNPERAVQNRNVVLRVMREEGMIGESQLAEALDEPLRLRERERRGLASAKRAPYFVDYVIDSVRRQLPQVDLDSGGYRIETTLNLRMQAAADKAVRDLVREYRRARVRTAAFLLMDRDGRILAMVGGENYGRNQFNMITQGRRQPGSSFKPLVYGMAFDRGALSPSGSVSNERFTWTNPQTGVTWAPKNASGRYGGMVSVRTAVAASLNMPAIRVLEKVGPQAFAEYARAVYGIQSPLDPVLPLALGATALRPLELAQAYSVFMRQGSRVTPFGVTRVVAPDGSVLVQYQPNVRDNVMGRASAEAMDLLLRQVVVGSGGTARRARPVVNARGKTGTTSDNRDAWFVGYTNQFLGLGWVANEVPATEAGQRVWRYEPMSSQVFGGTVTIKVWTDVMLAAQRLMPEALVDLDASRSAPLVPPAEDGAFDGTEDRAVDDAAVTEDVARPSAPPGVEPEPGEVPADPDAPAEGEAPGGGGTSPPALTPPPASSGQAGGPRKVSFTICADSGMLANDGCPEQYVEEFARGSEPRRRCTLH